MSDCTSCSRIKRSYIFKRLIMESIITTITVAALKNAVTLLTKKILEMPWGNDVLSAKEIIRQLSEDYTSETYAEKYISRFMRMRTLHSAESDVYLDQIYTPLTLTVQSNKDQIIVDNNTTLSYSKIINIIGLAGQGKSTILKKLFLEELHVGKRFPFIIELRSAESSSIVDIFKEQLSDIGIVFNDGEPELFLQSKKIVLMLDGFDEIATKYRQKILNEINQLKMRYNCDVIVTTRPDTEICTEVGIINLKINTLNTNDIISILSKLDKNNNLSELPKIIAANKNLQETLISPILVNLLYVCYPYLDIIPESVTDFYDKLFITLYSRHDKIKNFNREKNSPLSSIVANNVFNGLCFYSLNKGILDFSESTLYEYITKSLTYHSIESSLSEQIEKDFINITCLIQRDGFDKYVFLHKSIQEFHAAKFIASLSYKNKLKFYEHICKTIDDTDAYDNVLSFLKILDPNDYNLLLIIEYFKQHQIFSDNISKKTDEIVHSVLYNSTCSIEMRNKKPNMHSIDAFWENGIFAAFSLFLHGSRTTDSKNKKSLQGKLVSSLLTKTYEINIEQLDEKLQELNIDENKLYENYYVIRVSDYLNMIGLYKVWFDFLRNKIFNYHKTIYQPISQSVNQASTIFNMDFEL